MSGTECCGMCDAALLEKRISELESSLAAQTRKVNGLKEFVAEVAIKPYADSDTASLLGTLRNRARYILKEIES